MQKILRKRILREFKENLFRYLALMLLIIVGMYMVIGIVGAADTVIIGTQNTARENLIEDGQFSVFSPLTDSEISKIREAKVTLEEHFYLDFKRADGSVIRIFCTRKHIDLAAVDSGNIPKNSDEIFLEKRYCEENGISVGDRVSIGSKVFTVSGIGSVPDYESVVRNMSDSAIDSKAFGLGFVSEESYSGLQCSGGSISSEEYLYAYRLGENVTDKKLKDILREFKMEAGGIEDSLPKMTQFTSAKDNPRIGAAADDKAVDHAAGLAAGVIVLLLFAYVISVFTVHGIERESGVIGTLYAMGVKKKELLRHYLTLPVSVSFLAGMIGTAMGYSRFGVERMMSEPYGYYSMPQMGMLFEPYLLVYGIIMPPVAAAITNFLVIRKKLAKPALALIRGEQKSAGGRNIRLHGGFVRVFQIRQLLREGRTAVTVFFGMFISLLVVMLALNCYILCEHLKTDSVADTKFEYMYTYKYPEETLPEGGKEAYGVSMKKEALGYKLDVMLLGIHPDNPYFDVDVETLERGVAISSAAAEKFRLKEGDILVLTDEESDRLYAFFVEDIVSNSSGFYAFMDMDDLRELMGEDSDYYNIVFASHALDIDNARLYSVLTRKDVEKSSSVFTEMMRGMVSTLTVASVLIFVVILYLMMRVMIDRQTMHISMFKIFGYRKKEIGKLYLNGNLFVVVFSALTGIPLSKIIMDAIYPYLVANVACSMNLTFPWRMYAFIFAAILVLYFVIDKVLVRRISRILPAEALKNRDL